MSLLTELNLIYTKPIKIINNLIYQYKVSETQNNKTC